MEGLLPVLFFQRIWPPDDDIDGPVMVLVIMVFPGCRHPGVVDPGRISHDTFRCIFIIRMKGSHMTIYVSLGNLSRDAFAQLDSLEERDRKAKKLIESLGGKLISLHYTFGRYDFIAMVDMPSKDSMVKFLTILGKHGTVKTETLETIPSETLYKIAKEV
jgi:uncharacterized protein with GYD domain